MNTEGWTKLLIATLDGNIDTVQRLLDNGTDVNENEPEGRTALFIASREGYYDIATLLLSHGADVNAKNNDGLTALKIARNWDHIEIETLLTDYIRSDEDKYEFLDENVAYNKELLTCPICLNVVYDPVVIKSCGHLFCKDCIEGVEDKRCPLCRNSSYDILKVPIINQLIDMLRVRCTKCNQEMTKEASRTHKCLDNSYSANNSI